MSSPDEPESVAVNREVWTRSNERVGRRQRAVRVAGGGDRLGDVARARVAGAGAARRSKASTSSSSAAASRTSPRGSPAGARARPASIRRPRSCSRRAGARTRRASVSRSSRVTASGCRFRTRRSISCSPSTAPRSGPTRTSGSPRRRACCDRTAGSCSCATARCRSSACPTPGRSRTTLLRPQFGMHTFDWRSDNDGIAFGLVSRRLDPPAARARLRDREARRDSGSCGRGDA